MFQTFPGENMSYEKINGKYYLQKKIRVNYYLYQVFSFFYNYILFILFYSWCSIYYLKQFSSSLIFKNVFVLISTTFWRHAYPEILKKKPEEKTVFLISSMYKNIYTHDAIMMQAGQNSFCRFLSSCDSNSCFFIKRIRSAIKLSQTLPS